MTDYTKDSVRRGKWWFSSIAFVFAVLLQFSAFGESSVNLTWDRSEGDDVAGYKIIYGTASGVYTEFLSVGNVTNANVTDLIEGTEYYFAVTAYNSLGLESDPSNEVSYFVSVPGPVGLAMQTVAQDGVFSLAVTATGTVPDQWTLESSVDLKTWSVYTNGAGGPINIQVPITAGPQLFFRLQNQ